jgi:hypothetical protein
VLSSEGFGNLLRIELRSLLHAASVPDPTWTVAKRPAWGYALGTMQPLKAHVHNGRLVLDEPTDLPEGEVLYLRPVEAAVGELDDGFDDTERRALHEALDEGIAAARAGDHVDAEAFTQELLARR